MTELGFERPDALWALLLLVPVVLMPLWSRRKLPVRRLVLATLVRVLLVVVLVLALAGLTRRKPVEDLGVVFVVDRSASIGAEGQRRALAFVKEALRHQGEEDRAGVVVFGADALLESEPREELVFEGVESAPSPHQSDLAAGLRLATAVLPSDRARRIVLLSDGEQTRGDAANQVLLTAGDDLEIAVVPLPTGSGADVLLEDVLLPARVDEGAPYELRVVARSEEPVGGRLRLYRNDAYLGEVPITLTGGRSDVFGFRQEARSAGLYRYRAVLEVDDASLDALPQNNEGVGTVQISGRPRVLLADGDPSQARHLRAVLEGEGFLVDVVGADGIPPNLAGLRPYQAVLFADIPAYALSSRQMEAIRGFVRDLGRGFLMIGGEQSFGVGGYFRTPIEEALPVRMDIDDKSPFPKLGMVVALDKSCSMGGGAGSKLAMAKEAGIRTVELLSDRDLFGAIGFDSAASWIVPLDDLDDRPGVIATLGSIRTGGGTDIYPALERSITSLDASDAALKHVILISDGVTAPAAFEPLLRGAVLRNHTVTAIAIGQDSDTRTMRSIADWGGGSFYLVTDPTAIPAIFTRETMLATRAFLVEEPFQPALAAPSDLLTGIRQDDLPVLGGYVATDPKPRSVVALTTGGDPVAPVLAHWHHGLGRAVAFTSDAKARWAKDWVGTESYTRFWAQVVRWVAQDPGDGAVQVEAEIREGELRVTVDAFDEGGAFRNFLEGEARIVTPELEVRPIELRQVAPGRYAASTPVDQDGSWLVGVALRDGGEVVGQGVVEAVQPYSPEYRARGAGSALLAELGRLGGGGLLEDPAEAFVRPAVPRRVPVPLWPPLLAASALLLLLDVAARRLDLGRRPALATGSLAAEAPAVSRRPPAPRRAVAAARVEEAEPEPEPEAAPAAPPPDPDSYAGRLLAARRSARRRMGDDE